jgi:hypothetical protein
MFEEPPNSEKAEDNGGEVQYLVEDNEEVSTCAH